MGWPVGGLAALAAVAVAAPGPAGAAGGPAFRPPSRADDPAVEKAQSDQLYVNEPATAYAKDGTRYVAYQRASQLSYTRDGGRHWSYVGGSDTQAVLSRNVTGCTEADDIGDVELATDQTGRIYFADLGARVNTGANGADTGVEPIVAHSDDRFAHWSGTCAAHQPASVDREWMAAWTPPGKTADASNVYLSYHDFSPVNTIWVNASHDGGKTWSQPVDVITSAAGVQASFCDTVPAGTAVDPRNGWVYVAWTAGNLVDNVATGCNYTQGAVFNSMWVAVSKDGGATWTPSVAFTGPDETAATPSDLSEIFGSLAVDRQGSVYVTFPATLAGEYDAYIAYSPPADSSGALHFTKPVRVNGADVKTAYFVRAVAGDRGRVDVIYLGSPVKNLIATPANKLSFTGSDAAQPNCSPETSVPASPTDIHGTRFPGKPCQMPKTAPWYLYLAQSLNLTSGTPTFTTTKLRPDAVHTGDICTLGIFCLTGDNRDLADVNDVRIDATGGAQVAYGAENTAGTHTEIDFQCQRSGPGLYAGVTVRDCQTAAARSARSSLHRAGATLAKTGGMPLAIPAVLLLVTVLAAAARARWRHSRAH